MTETVDRVESALALSKRLSERAAPTLLEIIAQLVLDVDAIAEDTKVIPAHTARVLYAVREAHELLDKQVKVLYHVKDKLDKGIVPSRLELFEEDRIRVPEIGRSFGIVTKTSATFLDKERGFAWLREMGQGDLVQETVNAGTLSAYVRTLMVDEGMDPPSDIVEVKSYKTTSVTKYTPKG